MSKTAMRSLVVSVMVTCLWAGTTATGRANELGVGGERKEVSSEENFSLPISHLMREPLVAQLFYPPVSEDPTFRVVGRGRASQPADKATLQFKFIPDYPDEQPEGTLSDFDPTDEPLGKQKLQPIVDALLKIGVLPEEIELTYSPANSTNIAGDSQRNY